jgi:hypothetical protein
LAKWPASREVHVQEVRRRRVALAGHDRVDELCVKLGRQTLEMSIDA